MRSCARVGARLLEPLAPAVLCGISRSKSSTFLSTDERATSSCDGVSRNGMYSARGYDFLQGFRALGPAAALGRLRLKLSLYGFVGFVTLTGTVWYLTTSTYQLTTDPDPCLDIRHRHFSSDYAVLRNRWTGRRRVITLEGSDRSTPVEKHVRVNWLIYSVQLYLQPTESIVVVDVRKELSVDRFAVKCGRRSRLVSQPPPVTTTCATTTSVIGYDDATSALVKDPDGRSLPARLMFRSQLRLARVRNCYQKGSLPVYEQTVETVVRELLTERYRKALLSRTSDEIHPILANELLQNGQLNGRDVTWKDVVGNAADFMVEVRERVLKRVGDQVVLLHSTMDAL